MTLRILSGLALLGITTPAFAAGDITTSISGPTAVHVYEAGTYTVTASNIGNQTINGVVVTINLPRTHTSPSVYVMGTVGAMPTGCSRSNYTITCTPGTMKKWTSKSYAFSLTLPEAAEPLTITTTLTTTTAQNTANDNASFTAALDNYDVTFPSVAGDVFDLDNQHCTGTGLTSYYECTLFPSSISGHEATFTVTSDFPYPSGTISFPTISPDYGGTWYSDTPDHLVWEYTELGTPIAEFEGWGTNNTTAQCWEGITNFLPSSTYMAPYRICVL